MKPKSPVYIDDLAKLKGPSFGCYNVRSVVNKLDDLKLILSRSGLNFIGLTETWLNHSTSDLELELGNYRHIRLDRSKGRSNKEGGGLIAYIDNRYRFEHITDWDTCMPDMEMLWFKLTLKLTRPTYVCVCYRPPDGSADNFMDLLEQKYIEIQGLGIPDTIVMGDININLLKRADNVTIKYKNMLKRLQLHSLINQPTRVTLTTKSCTDHILVSNPAFYVNAGQIKPRPSDHSMLYVSRKHKRQKRTVQYMSCRSFTHFDPLAYQKEVSDAAWSVISTCADPNVATHFDAG